MKHVFGPVPSRRLGRSLGIDTIPLKTCNWNCVYCQLGRSIPLTNERREYIPSGEILTEVRQVLANSQDGDLDWVTFVGSGEPTLHSGLGKLIGEVKGMTSLPVAVITNGSLLYLPEIRRDLRAADAVMPSLDAGSPALYRKVNRPWPKLDYERFLAGLIAFRQEYQGKLWIEVMLVKGLNDTEEALQDIAPALDKIQPDLVHLSLPIRPPAETWVRPADETGLQRAQAIIGEAARVVQPNVEQGITQRTEELESAILGIITRHPLREDEATALLDRWPAEQVRAVFAGLEQSGKAQVVERYGVRFWGAAGGRYPQAEGSLRPSR